MRKTRRSFLAVGIALSWMLMILGCTDFVPDRTSASSSDLPSSGSSDLAAEGKTLYQSYCMSCHGDVSSSSKMGRSAAEIQAAIQAQSSMNSLSTLSASDLSAIAIALNATTIVQSGTSSSFRPVVSNRYLLASDLTELFVDDVTPDASDTSIKNVISTMISKHPEAFGGGCTRNDPNCSSVCGTLGNIADCAGKLSVSINADALPTVDAVRKGYMIQACEQILAVDKSVKTLTSKAGVSSSTAPTSAAITSLLSFAYPTQPSDANSVTQLMAIATAGAQNGFSTLDQWRFVMLPVCESNGIDLL